MIMSKPTSISLLKRICKENADPQDWKRFYDLYWPLLISWARRHFQLQDADAEDLAQKVLLVVVKKLPKFQHNGRVGAFRKWLRETFRNRVMDFQRSKKYRPVATGKTDFQQQLNELADDSSGISQIWNREYEEFVMKKLMELVEPDFEPKTWLAFRRLVFDGVSADVVATVLDMTLGAVYTAKYKVLKAFKDEARGLIDM